MNTRGMIKDLKHYYEKINYSTDANRLIKF